MAGTQALDGVSARDCKNGARYFRLHYSADPEKDADWAAREKAGTPPREWQREMEMAEDVWDGQPVYECYKDALHCSPNWASGIPIIEGSRYFGGWDCGQTLQPAFVLLQVTEINQVHALLEVTSNGAESMQVFAPRVLAALQQWSPIFWDAVEHVGDATVNQRSGGDGRTARQIALIHGVQIDPISNAWMPRRAAVTWALMDMLTEKAPRYMVDPIGCPVLRKGFQGAYRYREAAAGESSGPGVIVQEPLKNGYSHIHDANQYATLAVQRYIQGTGARIHHAGAEPDGRVSISDFMDRFR